MSLVTKLSCLALRPVLRGVSGFVLPGVELNFTDEAAGAIEQFLVTRFTDPSKQLLTSLSRAADRSWRAVEIALAGESFWSWLTDRGEDKAFRADIRTFLDSNPLQFPPGRDESFRRAALDQLRAARKLGLIPGDRFSPKSAAKQTTDFLQFASPVAVCEAEWRVMAEVAGALRESRHSALADLVELRPVPNQPPLLAVAVRFFFRREVETNRQLFQGLVYDQVDQVGQALEAGLGRLHDALQNHGARLLEILTLAEAIHADVLNLKSEQAKLGEGFRELYSAVSGLGEKLDRLHERNLRQTDATSIRGGTERQLVKALKARFRALSEPQRQQVPALLNAIGKLEMAAGEYEEAHQDFRQVASLVNDRAAKAAAHNNAFLAALEKKDWTTALKELMEASRLDPDRFSLFPLDRYEPERIVGAGGFGIVFLCRNRLSKARMVVKALRTDELDRDLSAVLEEAGAMEQLSHDAIIRLRDCGYADANQTRPYLVMDYFDGVTLDDFIKKHGLLSAQDARVLACQMAEGLSAAHAKEILHRDVKPGNVLLERVASGLRIKLIDFGLAMRQQVVHNTISNASALSNTIRGQSIAGTLDYAAPEQMGKLPGEAITPRSDVYGYGRTLCFALFGTPKPGPDDWDALEDKPFKKLIGECIKEDPKNRPAGFAQVLARLGATATDVAPLDVAPSLTQPLSTQSAADSDDKPLSPKAADTAAEPPVAKKSQRTEEAPQLPHAVGVLARLDRSSPFTCLSFSPDGEMIVAGGGDQKAYLWHPRTNQVTSYSFPEPIKGIAFSPDGQQFCVVGGSSRTIPRSGFFGGLKKLVEAYPPSKYSGYYAVWQVANGQIIHEQATEDQELEIVTFSPDGSKLIFANAYGKLRELDAGSGTRQRAIREVSKLTEDYSSYPHFSADRKFAVLMRDDISIRRQEIILYSVDNTFSYEKIGIWQSDAEGALVWKAVSRPPLHKEVIVYNSKELSRYDLQGHKQLRYASDQREKHVAVSMDGNRLLSASDRYVQLWDVQSGREIHRFEIGSSFVAFSPDGRFAAVAAGNSVVLLGLPE